MKSQSDALHLTEQQLKKLFRIGFYIFQPAYHHLSRDLARLAWVHEVCQRRCEKIRGQLAAKRNQRSVTTELSLLRRELKSCNEAIEELGRSLRTYLDSFTIPDKMADLRDHPFLSRPHRIIEAIQDVHKRTQITIDKSSTKTLEFVYPRNVLYAILNELIENAERSVSGKCSIVIKWQLRTGKFRCEVHDNGPGINPSIGDKFVPLDALKLRKSRLSQRGVGLSILHMILTQSQGLLLFSNSGRLGGSLVYFEFPTIADLRPGRVYDQKKRTTAQ